MPRCVMCVSDRCQRLNGWNQGMLKYASRADCSSSCSVHKLPTCSFGAQSEQTVFELPSSCLARMAEWVFDLNAIGWSWTVSVNLAVSLSVFSYFQLESQIGSASKLFDSIISWVHIGELCACMWASMFVLCFEKKNIGHGIFVGYFVVNKTKKKTHKSWKLFTARVLVTGRISRVPVKWSYRAKNAEFWSFWILTRTLGKWSYREIWIQIYVFKFVW